MELRVLAATNCASSACPTIYQADDETIVVQGYTTDACESGVDVPTGESLVRIPKSLLIASLAGLQGIQ